MPTLKEAIVSTNAKILTLDIETRPLTSHTWGLWDQNISINQIIDPGGVMCWAAKWYGQNRAKFASDFHDGHQQMVEQIWELCDEADVIVGYNHKKFDMKFLRREWLLAGLPSPTPWQDIDLLNVVRQQFKFPSNKLDYVARELGIGTKVKHEGFDLWTSCMAGDEKAWGRMRRYNIQDVRLTERLLDRLRPHIRNHPNLNMFGPRASACHACGSKDLEDAGEHVTATRAYPRFRCRTCQSLTRSTISDSTKTRHRRSGM